MFFKLTEPGGEIFVLRTGACTGVIGASPPSFFIFSAACAMALPVARLAPIRNARREEFSPFSRFPFDKRLQFSGILSEGVVQSVELACANAVEAANAARIIYIMLGNIYAGSLALVFAQFAVLAFFKIYDRLQQGET